MPLEIRKRFGRPFLELSIVTACDRVLVRLDLHLVVALVEVLAALCP